MSKATYDKPGSVATTQVWKTGTNLVFHTRVYRVTHRNLVLKHDEDGYYLMVEDPHRGWLRVSFEPASALAGTPPS